MCFSSPVPVGSNPEDKTEWSKLGVSLLTPLTDKGNVTQLEDARPITV
jgi:hypothetical protein